MTMPSSPPVTVGLAPRSADELNQNVGFLLRQFTEVRGKVLAQEGWLLAEDIKAEPYNFSADQETLIKSAISSLNTALQGVDMTFINRLIGLPA